MTALGPVQYQRTFGAAETREIRLYGRDGTDVFAVDGERGADGPQLRVVGGARVDTLREQNGWSTTSGVAW